MNLLYPIILAVTTFVWGWIFYKKEYHPQPIRVIIQSFVAGAFSMLPLFAYRYLYENFLPRLSEIQIIESLFESNVFSGLAFFLLNMLIITSLVTIFAGVISLFLTRFKHETLQNIRGTLKDDEFEFVTMSMMIAVLIYAERFVEFAFNVQIINAFVGSILFLAIIEEYVKHLTVRFIDDKKIRDVDDAITLSIVVGLSFAFFETLIYSARLGDPSLILPRAILSVPIHLIASGIFGYYYGLAKYAKPILKANRKGRVKPLRFKWFYKFFKLKRLKVYEEEKTAQGLIFATLFHTVVNVLFELNLAYITVPIIVVGLGIVTYFYKKSKIIHSLIHKD